MSKYKLVLANGAFKSGSTWLRDIILNMLTFADIPSRYARRSLPHWINPSKIPDFLEDDSVQGCCISKSHIYDSRTVSYLLSRADVRILNISRDIKDVIVSHYYHYNLNRKHKLTFSDYYWSVGRFKAYEVISYHKTWDVESPNLFLTTFSGLKTDFEGQVRRIANFLNHPISSEDVAQIANKTSLQSLMKKRSEEDKPESQRFFRKGIIGDWRNHFSPFEKADIDQVASSGLVKTIDKLRYFAAFQLRRSLVRPGRR